MKNLLFISELRKDFLFFKKSFRWHCPIIGASFTPLLFATPIMAAEELHMFNWNDYISKKVVAQFEKDL